MNVHEKINYVEFPARNLEVAKAFFAAVFGWEFVDYGAEYVAFSGGELDGAWVGPGAGLDGGFYKSQLQMAVKNGSALVVFYSADLAATQAKIEAAGGVIIAPIFAFPGGRRFHFGDPNGNEYAVWSDAGGA